MQGYNLGLRLVKGPFWYSGTQNFAILISLVFQRINFQNFLNLCSEKIMSSFGKLEPPLQGDLIEKLSKVNGCSSEMANLRPIVGKAKMCLRSRRFLQFSKNCLNFSAVCLTFFRITYWLLNTFWLCHLKAYNALF